LSQINTNGIDVNYPSPGKNNSTQGFRDNFTQIKNNLDIASQELSDLQSKVLLKAALNNSVLDNNMANAQISNVSTRGFRGTTYNLGNALSTKQIYITEQ
jgi:spore germination protein YaaH